ncbi:hypothetical protein BDK51DRAFT_27853 [Blyttiomyces helicus]|uniref:SAC domain-containing protein n=1 Tax=Blyttiomyces helicus TaxID=388810 RepID=A0A4P9W5C7_9FUNG|nr:hypothetical protein BDK51DRAFT_27853 [Blyttiomyces helicus]|eukprot:RKO87599.1 hypothetical protein BDK51DRAFT_27853 [Blyttiomyces helicus]
MDCLDRTNVVQSVLARRSLTLQLRDLGILEANEIVENTGELEKMFKNVWAENADEVSRQYSGTGALKTDFTRTGKRTKAGALQDLSNSIVRYVRNNFFDGGRQDGFDLLLGVYRVGGGSGVSPFAVKDKPLLVILLPLGIILSIFMIMASFLVQSHATYTYHLLFTTFWLMVIVASFRMIFRHGLDFVDVPRLERSQHLAGSGASHDNIQMVALDGLEERKPPFAEKREGKVGKVA